MSSIQAFFTNIVYPQAAINRAQGLVGAVQGLYTQIQATSRVNVSSATLANPQQLEQVLLSRNPMNVPNVTANYQTLYQTVPTPRAASPQTRDLVRGYSYTTVAFTGAVQPEFCSTRQRRRSMLPTGSVTTAARSLRRHTRLFFGMRRSERDRHRRRPLLKRGSSSLQHRLVLAYHSCHGEAYDQITPGTLFRAGPISFGRPELTPVRSLGDCYAGDQNRRSPA